MSLSIRNDNEINGAILEKVITDNDLGGLSSLEKVQHIKNVCQSLGLNPLTKPIQLIKFQGKEIAYFTKDATEQLRKNNGISLKIRETKVQEGVYIVIADAKTPEGREDSSTGSVYIKDLKGDALCNAMLKAETKAKRRVTLSICGLGFTDESELETMKGHTKLQLQIVEEPKKTFDDDYDTDQLDLNADIERISKCETMEYLDSSYKAAYKFWAEKKDKERLNKIIEVTKKIRDELKNKILQNELDSVDVETGEIK